ncbi:hypothetical protein MESS4_830409 [Mesorhizobium sp. STM 4661]|nr:hypothetical protein MESS4_830409 [Mesorhizobium sp. STM 4661]
MVIEKLARMRQAFEQAAQIGKMRSFHDRLSRPAGAATMSTVVKSLACRCPGLTDHGSIEQ